MRPRKPLYDPRWIQILGTLKLYSFVLCSWTFAWHRYQPNKLKYITGSVLTPIWICYMEISFGLIFYHWWWNSFSSSTKNATKTEDASSFRCCLFVCVWERIHCLWWNRMQMTMIYITYLDLDWFTSRDGTIEFIYECSGKSWGYLCWIFSSFQVISHLSYFSYCTYVVFLLIV